MSRFPAGRFRAELGSPLPHRSSIPSSYLPRFRSSVLSPLIFPCPMFVAGLPRFAQHGGTSRFTSILLFSLSPFPYSSVCPESTVRQLGTGAPTGKPRQRVRSPFNGFLPQTHRNPRVSHPSAGHSLDFSFSLSLHLCFSCAFVRFPSTRCNLLSALVVLPFSVRDAEVSADCSDSKSSRDEDYCASRQSR